MIILNIPGFLLFIPVKSRLFQPVALEMQVGVL